jgi:hypothetical protein
MTANDGMEMTINMKSNLFHPLEIYVENPFSFILIIISKINNSVKTGSK